MAELESLGSIPLALAAVIGLFGGAAGLGGLLVRAAAPRQPRWGEVLLLRLVAGLNLLGVTAIVLGWPGLLARGRSVWLLLALSSLAAADVWRRWRATAGAAVGWRRRWPQAGFAVLAILTLGPALCYPTDWDELVYHQVLPQRWLADGWPAFYPDLPHSGFPSLGEILFWLMAPVEGVIAPRLLIWSCWLLGLVCLYRLLRRRLAPGAAAVFALVFPLNDTVLLTSAHCYVEPILMMDAAALLLAAEFFRQRGSGARPWRGAVVMGVLAGGAASVKLTGCALLAVPALWYVGQAWRDRGRWRPAAGSLALCLLAALCVCFPFYLRPWLATGNPFYPYLCGLFTSDPARLEMSRHHHAIGGVAFGVKSVAAFVDAPLLLAFRARNYDGEFGWQLLVLVVLAAVGVASASRLRVRAVLWWPAAASFWLYCFWFATSQQARFAVPAALAFVPVAGSGLQRLRGAWRRLVLAVLAAAALASVPWQRSGYYWYSAVCAAGRLSRTDYVHNATNCVYLPLVGAIRARTPAGAKLMLLYEHRGFYLPRPHVIGTPLFQEAAFTPPERFGEAAAVMEVLVRDGITHLVMAKADPSPEQAPGWIERQQPLLRAIEECLRQGRLRGVWESEAYLLLEVRG